MPLLGEAGHELVAARSAERQNEDGSVAIACAARAWLSPGRSDDPRTPLSRSDYLMLRRSDWWRGVVSHRTHINNIHVTLDAGPTSAAIPPYSKMTWTMWPDGLDFRLSAE